MTSAVPRSGCAAISSTAAAPTPRIGPAAVRRLWASLGRAAMHRRGVQDERELHQLGGLELQRAGADPAARAVDLDAEAGDQHEQQQDERDQQQVRREAADVLEPLAGDDLHRHEPDRAVDEVLDEVGGAVAVALQQRARARRRVDHHRAAREQTQGCGEQQPVLERLRLLASVHRSWFRHPRRRPLPCDLRPRARGSARRAPRSRHIGRRRRRRARAGRPRRARRGARGGDRASRGRRCRAAARRCPPARRAISGRGLADQVDGAGALGHRAGERRVAAGLAAAAQDQVEAALERLDAGDRGGDVRGLGVVDVEHAVVGGDLLEPVRDAGELASPSRTASGAMPRASTTAAAAIAFWRLWAPRSRISSTRDRAARRPTTAPPSRSAQRARRARRRTARARPRRRRPVGGELRRRDGDRAGRLAGEHLELGGLVGVERAVAVEVVLGEVEQHAGVGSERSVSSSWNDDASATTIAASGRPEPTSEVSAVPTLPTTTDRQARGRGGGGRSARPSWSSRSSR